MRVGNYSSMTNWEGICTYMVLLARLRVRRPESEDHEAVTEFLERWGDYAGA